MNYLHLVGLRHWFHVASPIQENSWAIPESTRKAIGLNSSYQSCNSKNSLANLWRLGDFSTPQFQWDNRQEDHSCLRWPVRDCCSASQTLQPSHPLQRSDWKVLWLSDPPTEGSSKQIRARVRHDWKPPGSGSVKHHPLPLDITC